jgi:DNA-binding transcriptional ArsR family regulator
MRNGPLTPRGLAADTKLSIATARYHLGVLCEMDAAKPFLVGMADVDEIAYRLTPENLADREEEILLGELSLQTCGDLVAHLLREGPLSATELSERTGLSPREVERYLKRLCIDAGAPRAKGGSKPDRRRDYPEWYLRWLRGITEKDNEDEERGGS